MSRTRPGADIDQLQRKARFGGRTELSFIACLLHHRRRWTKAKTRRSELVLPALTFPLRLEYLELCSGPRLRRARELSNDDPSRVQLHAQTSWVNLSYKALRGAFGQGEGVLDASVAKRRENEVGQSGKRRIRREEKRNSSASSSTVGSCGGPRRSSRSRTQDASIGRLTSSALVGADAREDELGSSRAALDRNVAQKQPSSALRLSSPTWTRSHWPQ